MKVRFTRVFDWEPDHYKGLVTVVVQPGIRQVTRECARKAIEAGAAEACEAENADSGRN